VSLSTDQDASGTDPLLGTTADLLRRVRRGDAGARESLIRRVLPPLRRWARGRLRGAARTLAETDDLVQTTLLKVLDRLETFEPRREGAFLMYLRTTLLNTVRYEARRHAARPDPVELDEQQPDPSPVEESVGRDTLRAYEEALRALPPHQQEAVVLRIEFGYSHREIAEAIGSPSENAARMTVTRALDRLAEFLDDARS